MPESKSTWKKSAESKVGVEREKKKDKLQLLPFLKLEENNEQKRNSHGPGKKRTKKKLLIFFLISIFIVATIMSKIDL